MLAFRVLATGLADAYQVATGRQATIPYDAYKEINHGPFLDLVEAVLPLTAELAQGLGKPLHFPKRMVSSSISSGK